MYIATLNLGASDFSVEEEEQTRNCRLLEMSRNSSKWFVQDPCGIACAVATYVFLIYGEIVALVIILPAFPTLGVAPIILLFTVLVILSIVSHVKAMLTNPVSHVCLTIYVNDLGAAV